MILFVRETHSSSSFCLEVIYSTVSLDVKTFSYIYIVICNFLFFFHCFFIFPVRTLPWFIPGIGRGKAEYRYVYGQFLGILSWKHLCWWVCITKYIYIIIILTNTFFLGYNMYIHNKYAVSALISYLYVSILHI